MLRTALTVFVRKLPLFVLVVVAAVWFTRAVQPSPSELTDPGATEPQMQLRQQAVQYAAQHWGLQIENPITDIAIFSSEAWSFPTSWMTMSHYTLVVRGARPVSEVAGGAPLPDTDTGLPDIYRFDVSSTSDGIPLRFGYLRQLTHTEHVDETNLVSRGSQVAFSNFQSGRHDAVIVIDLIGEPDRETSEWPRSSRVVNALTNLQRVGQFRGMGRAQYLFSYPPTDLDLSFVESGVLRMELGARGALELNLAASDQEIDAEGTFRVRRIPKIQEPLIFGVTDLVRNLPFIGPDRMAVVQRIVFDLADMVKRRERDWFGHEEIVEVTGTADPLPIPEEPREGFGVLIGEETRRSRLPLERADSIVERRRRSEGRWAPVEETVPTTPESVPLFYQTYVRVDEERDYAVVHATVWDPDRLRLGVVAGTEEPVPTTSALGTGRIPRDADFAMTRFVAAFNGGFQTVHGTYGMIEDKQVVVPPRELSGTVATFEGDRVAMGRWLEGYELPIDLVGLRQNLRPLVENGEANPDGRMRWGWALGQTRANLGSPMTTRTGICRLENGAMGYFFGTEIDGQMLANAMVAVGCDFGLHLDMNPGHTGLEYYSVRDSEGEDFDARTMRRGMGLARHPRYIRQDTRDFFYLTLRSNPQEDTLPATCGQSEGPRYHRLTSEVDDAGQGLELLLAPARAVALIDRPLCDQPDVVTEVLRLPAHQLRGQLSFYRDVPDQETLLRDQRTIMLPVESMEAPLALGLNRSGALAVGRAAVDTVGAFPLHSAPQEAAGYVVALEDGDFYLIASDSRQALIATAERASLRNPMWLPRPADSSGALRFDTGRVRTVPAGHQPAVPPGFVLWLDLEEDYSHSVRLDELLTVPEERAGEAEPTEPQEGG